MKKESLLNMVGFCLLGLCFAAAVFRVMSRTAREIDPEIITIRIAHWQLEGGVRDGLDAVAKAYEKRCAQKGLQVRVEQLTIPERVYSNWFVTQLVGGTAPDVIELGYGLSEERQARFFEPLTSYLETPNPYNEGTELEGTAWRNTFLDGLNSAAPVLTSPYSPTLLEFYSIPLTMHTVRVYYNKALYKEIMGDKGTPVTYQEFIDLCEATQKYGRDHNRTLIPIAGSRYNSPVLMNRLFASQTQKLGPSLYAGLPLKQENEETTMSYLKGEWTLDSPEVVSGLKLNQQVGKHMLQGFLQLGREDATFYFVQSRALMIATGSWDSMSLRQQSPFPLGVFRIPLPTTQDPEYGANMLGTVSEAGTGTSAGFGLNRNSPHMEQALDFLKFMTSKEGQTEFCRLSGWLPCVLGVEPTENARPFLPIMDGYPQGFELNAIGGGGNNAKRIFESNMYLLINSPDTLPFRQKLREEFRDGLVEDVKLLIKTRNRSIERADTTLAALATLQKSFPDRPAYGRKLAELTEAQNQQEMESTRFATILRNSSAPN